MNDDEDIEDAPESLSLLESKKNTRRKEANLLEFQAAEKLKKKARNRARDSRLKAQAELRKVRDAEVGTESAVNHAEGEMAGDGSESEEGEGESHGQDEGEQADEDGDSDLGSDDGMAGNKEDEDDSDHANGEEDEEGDEDESMLSAGDDDYDEENRQNIPLPATATGTKANPNHLPDHLFASVFASQLSKAQSQSSKPQTASEPLSRTKGTRKRPRRTHRPKDIIIGSRVVRTLEDSARPGPPTASTIPRRKVRNFIDRCLGLKGGNSKSKGWTRKPAQLGVLKTDGPPVNFFRRR